MQNTRISPPPGSLPSLLPLGHVRCLLPLSSVCSASLWHLLSRTLLDLSPCPQAHQPSPLQVPSFPRDCSPWPPSPGPTHVVRSPCCPSSQIPAATLTLRWMLGPPAPAHRCPLIGDVWLCARSAPKSQGFLFFTSLSCLTLPHGRKALVPFQN